MTIQPAESPSLVCKSPGSDSSSKGSRSGKTGKKGYSFPIVKQASRTDVKAAREAIEADKRKRAARHTQARGASIQFYGFISSVIFFVVSMEVLHNYITMEYGRCAHIFSSEIPRRISLVVLVFEAGVSCSTLFMLYGVVLYHYGIFKESVSGSLIYKDLPFSTYPNRMKLIFEILIVAFHCPPGVSGCFGGDVYSDPDAIYYPIQIFSSAVFVRCYVLLRYLKFSGRFSQQTGRIVLSVWSQRASTLTMIKDLLVVRPFEVFISTYLITIALFAYLIVLAERPTVDLDSTSRLRWAAPHFFQCFYFFWTVISTVGFGDWFPLSVAGRALTITGGIIGSLVSAMLISLAQNVLTAGPEELKVGLTLDWVRAKNNLEYLAADMLIWWWRAKHSGSKNELSKHMAAQQAFVAERRKIADLRKILDHPTTASQKGLKFLNLETKMQSIINQTQILARLAVSENDKTREMVMQLNRRVDGELARLEALLHSSHTFPSSSLPSALHAVSPSSLELILKNLTESAEMTAEVRNAQRKLQEQVEALGNISTNIPKVATAAPTEIEYPPLPESPAPDPKPKPSEFVPRLTYKGRVSAKPKKSERETEVGWDAATMELISGRLHGDRTPAPIPPPRPVDPPRPQGFHPRVSPRNGTTTSLNLGPTPIVPLPLRTSHPNPRAPNFNRQSSVPSPSARYPAISDGEDTDSPYAPHRRQQIIQSLPQVRPLNETRRALNAPLNNFSTPGLRQWPSSPGY